VSAISDKIFSFRKTIDQKFVLICQKNSPVLPCVSKEQTCMSLTCLCRSDTISAWFVGFVCMHDVACIAWVVRMCGFVCTFINTLCTACAPHQSYSFRYRASPKFFHSSYRYPITNLSMITLGHTVNVICTPFPQNKACRTVPTWQMPQNHTCLRTHACMHANCCGLGTTAGLLQLIIQRLCK
jgi:hypothetical protein